VLEVALQHQRIEFLQGAADGQGLAQDIDAVDILIDHALDAAHVALNTFQAIDQPIFFI
jgi:hypothetical protein